MSVKQDNDAFKEGQSDRLARKKKQTSKHFADTHPDADADDYPFYEAGYEADREDLQLAIEPDNQRIDMSPFSSSTTDNWVARLGGLPPYIRGVTRGIMKTNGDDFEAALATAITAIKLWASGKQPWSKNHAGKPTAATQAKAQAALAQWEQMKAEAHAGMSKRSVIVTSVQRAQTLPAWNGGAYGTGHPFHGNQHTGPIIQPHKTKQQKQQQAHQKAHNTAHNTASATAKATAARNKQQKNSKLSSTLAQEGSGGPLSAAATVPPANDSAPPASVVAQTQAAANKAAGSAGASQAAASAAAAKAAALQKIQLNNAVNSATQAYDAAKSNVDTTAAQQKQNVAFTIAKISNTTSASQNAQNQQNISAVELAAQIANKNAKNSLNNSEVSLWGAMKAAGFRQIDESISVFELRDGFLGEMSPGGAAAFLPAGPTAEQDSRIKKKLVEPQQRPSDRLPDRKVKHHIFEGTNLQECEKCGFPASDAIHQGVADPHAQIISDNTPSAKSGTVTQTLNQYSSRGVYGGDGEVGDHRFIGHDLMSCEFPLDDGPCGKHILHPDHSTGEGGVKAVTAAAMSKAPGQPIPPIPRMVRAADGELPSSVHSSNTRNFELVSAPLEAALRAHFHQQSKATINRLMGKRGGTMLKRAAAAYPKLPRDAEEVSTSHSTTPHGDPQLDAAQIAEQLSEPEAPAAVVDPHDVFDETHWSARTRELLEPHLLTAAHLAAGNVKQQLKLDKIEDTTGTELARAQMADRARDAAAAVTHTTAKHISGALQEGVANGESREQIRDRIEHVFGVAADQRAQQIAQSQAMGGYNEAALTYARHLPDGITTTKTWLADADSTTRLEHRLAHHQSQRLSDPFMVGGVALDYPGDTTAPIDSWVNCRCSQAFTA